MQLGNRVVIKDEKNLSDYNFRNLIPNVLTLIAISFPSISFACNCYLRPIEDHMHDASKVYVGTLKSSRIVGGLKDSSAWPTSYIEGTIKVESKLKGNVSTEEKIQTSFSDSGACGIPMTIGEEYIIFTRGNTNQISACDGSRLTGYEKNKYIDNLKELMSSEKS